MSRLAWSSSFRRAFKRRVRKSKVLEQRIFEVLHQLAEDPFLPALRSHKLSGNLEGLWACWVEYDCRIIFAFAQDPEYGEQVIVLIDIGSHDEVY
ncbi:MAG: type II toxin-antitoxin system YafQ family toxin [Anaerolineae bacterium]